MHELLEKVRTVHDNYDHFLHSVGRNEVFINKLQHFSYCSQRVSKVTSSSGGTGIHVWKRKVDSRT